MAGHRAVRRPRCRRPRTTSKPFADDRPLSAASHVGSPGAARSSPATGPAPSGFPAVGAELDPALFPFARPVTGPAGLAAVTLDAGALAHSRGPAARFADVGCWTTREADAVSGRTAGRTVVGRPAVAATRRRRLPRIPGTNRTSIALRREPAVCRLPQPQIVLNTSERVFQRQVRIGAEREPDRRHRDKWFEELGSANWRHADRQTAASALSIRSVRPTSRRCSSPSTKGTTRRCR